MTTWRELWRDAGATLGSSMEARRMVERASGYDGAELALHWDEAAPDRAVPFLWGMVERRRDGMPLQYALGRWGFRRLDLLVDRRVLIPRPETEVVVEVALGELRRMGLPRGPVVVDLGTGSGAIALAIACEARPAQVWATDVSAGALAVARANLAGIGGMAATKVRLAEGRWYSALAPDLKGGVDLIVSNPPYVAAGDELPPEVAGWEPAGALVSGPSGLEAIAEIVAGAPEWLARPGALVVEIAPHQAEAARGLATEAGLVDADVRPDLQDRPRVLVARSAS